jgi:hypothetical protein
MMPLVLPLHQIASRYFWLGKLAIEEIVEDNKRTITFSLF